MNKKDISRVIGIILLIFIVVTFYRQNVTTDHLFVSKNITEINNWTYNDTTIKNNKIDVSKNEIYKVESNFPLQAGKHLLLRSSLSHVSVSVDGQVIYKHGLEEKKIFKKPLASLWHLFEIPRDAETIQITYQSPYKKMSGLINPVFYGNRGDLLFHLFDIYGTAFIIDGLILFFGVLMILVALVNPKELFNSMWHIGIFAVIVAFWLIAESKMLQFFSGSDWIIGSTAFIALALIPMPLSYYIKNFISEESARPFNLCIKICWANLTLITLLQVFGISDFFETLWITHGFIVVFISITLSQLYYEVRVKKNKLAKHFLISLGILFVFVFIDFYRFYAFDGANVTLFARLGLMTFILLLGVETSKQLISFLRKSYKAAYYEQLAYLDQLTQGPNRTAFEKDLDEIFENSRVLPDLRLIILDMNQLKKINDVYGHVTGDEAIKISYDLIHKHFKHLGKTYRIGGDEFACIITDDKEVEFEKSCVLFHESIVEINKTIRYPIGIALGSVTYDPTLDTAVKKMMHRADTNMYEAKKEYKSLLA